MIEIGVRRYSFGQSGYRRAEKLHIHTIQGSEGQKENEMGVWFLSQ
jgi:hypothetical protein